MRSSRSGNGSSTRISIDTLLYNGSYTRAEIRCLGGKTGVHFKNRHRIPPILELTGSFSPLAVILPVIIAACRELQELPVNCQQSAILPVAGCTQFPCNPLLRPTESAMQPFLRPTGGSAQSEQAEKRRWARAAQPSANDRARASGGVCVRACAVVVRPRKNVARPRENVARPRKKVTRPRKRWPDRA
eukprot:gene8418-biopygen1596